MKSGKGSNYPVFYWDTCVIISWLKNNSDRTPEEGAGIDDIASMIHKNEARLVTGSITQGEILESTLTDVQLDKMKALFKRKNFMWIETTQRVWKIVHEIRDYYQKRKEIDNLPTLTQADSIHLASAIWHEVDEFHTFDEKDKPKRRALIPLNGNVAGHNLIIQKPGLAQQGLGLI